MNKTNTVTMKYSYCYKINYIQQHRSTKNKLPFSFENNLADKQKISLIEKKYI